MGQGWEVREIKCRACETKFIPLARRNGEGGRALGEVPGGRRDGGAEGGKRTVAEEA